MFPANLFEKKNEDEIKKVTIPRFYYYYDIDLMLIFIQNKLFPFSLQYNILNRDQGSIF